MTTETTSGANAPSEVIVRTFQEADRSAVIDLWRACGLTRPWNDPDLDIDRRLAVDDDGFMVAVDDTAIVGTAMVGYDGHRGWINYLAVDPSHRRGGLGRALMLRAEQYLGTLGCPKVNLQIRSDNVGAVAFYERLGYSVDDVVSMGRRLVDDQPPH